MKPNNTIPVCEKCKSQNVRKDSWAEWDDTDQCWILSTEFDHVYCMECENETNLEWIENKNSVSSDTEQQPQDQRLST